MSKRNLLLIQSISLILCGVCGLLVLLHLHPLLTRIAGCICLLALPVTVFTTVRTLLAAKQEK